LKVSPVLQARGRGPRKEEDPLSQHDSGRSERRSPPRQFAARARLLAAALLPAIAACDAQVTAGYPGEPLVTLAGRVDSEGTLPPLEAAMLWERGPPPFSYDQELATRAPVEAGFPSTFRISLYQPPPDAAKRALAPGEVVYARAQAAAVPLGTTDTQVASLPATPTAAYGIDAEHWVVYLAADVPAGSITEWWLGQPLPAGYHLLRITPVNPACLTGAAYDACVADLVKRGAKDDGTTKYGTARGLCKLSYRCAVAPKGELLVLKLGTVGIATAPSDCP
jgi:hypothetical protein